MERYLTLLQQTPLCRGLRITELAAMLPQLQTVPRQIAAGAFILQAGQKTETLGVLLEGKAQVVQNSSTGDRTIITDLGPGELFAEAFACAAPATPQLPVSVIAVAFCTVWLLNYPRLLALATGGQDQHGSYARLLGNLVSIMAQKNVTLNRRLRHLSHRSTREKLLSYLEEQAGGSPDGMFTIPFNRQELADYLCVERSAMSAVLSRLQKEGRITYQRNRFQLRPSVATEGPAQSTPENG